MVSVATFHEVTTSPRQKEPTSKTAILWITYINIALYALSYQLQTPVEPFLIKKLAEEAGDGKSVNETYGNVQSFFQVVQTVGSPLVGIALDRFGIRNTSVLVFVSSALSYGILAGAYDLQTLFISKIPTIFQAAFLVGQATAAASTGDDASARAAALGRMTTAYTIGATIGPVLGGYLADRGDFYIGAKLAVVGSLLSAFLSMVYLPRKGKEESTKKVETDSDAKQRTLSSGLRRSREIAFRSSLWPLLMVKALGGVVASMHSTSLPLVLTQKLKLEPSQLGMSISGSMIAVAAFGAVGMAPLTQAIGSIRMTHTGLLGRAVIGIGMATIIASATDHGDQFLGRIIGIAIMHALASHTLATGLTTQTTGAVANGERGTLLGIEHSLFSLARIGGPKIATALLSFGSGIWAVEVVCGISDVLLLITLLIVASQISEKKAL